MAGKMDPGSRNVYHMSVGFLLIFFGFNTAQNFVVPLLGTVGSWSLGLLYFVFTFTLLVAPPLTRQLGGPKMSMMIGGAGYALYLLSLVYLYLPTVMIGSVVIGASAAVLWTGQGAYQSQNSTVENSGALSGAFWGVMMLSNVLGNTSAKFVLGNDKNETNVCTAPPSTDAKTFSQGWHGKDSVLFL
eukprot:g6637.t1